MSITLPRSIPGSASLVAPLLWLTDTVAALMLLADLIVVCGSVVARSLFDAPVEWADDVARGLMVGSSFFGAASALARSEKCEICAYRAQPWATGECGK